MITTTTNTVTARLSFPRFAICISRGREVRSSALSCALGSIAALDPPLVLVPPLAKTSAPVAGTAAAAPVRIVGAGSVFSLLTARFITM